MCALILFCWPFAAVVNILPPLYELAVNITSNFQSWSEKRKLEIKGDSNTATSTASGAVTTPGAQITARPSVTTVQSFRTDDRLKPEVVEELRKVDERVVKFREKVTALKLPESDRTKKRRSSFHTNQSA